MDGVSLNHCPTDQIWAHILTKPMQGKVLREIRAHLMNCTVDYTVDMMGKVSDSRHQKPTGYIQETVSFKWEGSSLQECVGRSQK